MNLPRLIHALNLGAFGILEGRNIYLSCFENYMSIWSSVIEYLFLRVRLMLIFVFSLLNGKQQFVSIIVAMYLFVMGIVIKVRQVIYER